MIFFCRDMTTSSAAAVAEDDKISSVACKTWAGQADDNPQPFRLGNLSADDENVLVSVTAPDLQLSLNRRQWSAALTVPVKAGRTSDAIWISCIAEPSVTEGERIGLVSAGGASLTVNYFLAATNEGDDDSDKSQAYRYSGDNSREIRAFFESDGTTCRLREYTPIEKPTGAPTSLLGIEYRELSEWTNPMNFVVGWEAQDWYTKAFIGDPNDIRNRFYNFTDLSISFGDNASILLPHDFPGFDPSPRKHLVPFSQLTQWTQAYQGTIWTVFMADQEFCLRQPIRPSTFFRGQVLFWSADLAAVKNAGGDSSDYLWPWGELIDQDWRVIASVRSVSHRHVIADPYLP